MRGTLIGLTADQHYLKVETVVGESYIRGSLSDAMAALVGVPGLHIHRSYWVALRQIDRLVDDDGMLYCVMSSGKRYPVSRRRRAQTRAAVRQATLIGDTDNLIT
jgi:DNA-binding LytR/AlgR family response regulator